MEDRDLDADVTEGPEGEPFAEEERKRKYILGTGIIVVAILATFGMIYAFGLTSADVEEGNGDATKAAETEQK